MIAIEHIDAAAWQRFREVRLAALADAPYAFGSKLADWQRVGDTELRWRDRLSTVPFNVLARLDGRVAGMVSATAPSAERSIELISMWVAPFARGPLRQMLRHAFDARSICRLAHTTSFVTLRFPAPTGAFGET